MKIHNYRVQLTPEPEGGFTVSVPALPGCVTWGEDFDHACEMAREAVAGYLETLAALGKPVPADDIGEMTEAIIQVSATV